eukprot:TRINITY_DN19277_c0_g1_i2.p1 TRINITY_DN19277_c0_g1~~TRINITY_DN19277_c0_g1_i2.p1  ORF type:complete len:514 (-),score=58.57 TRINITY_DN19277_c0_g1_i2:35-1576(-)
MRAPSMATENITSTTGFKTGWLQNSAEDVFYLEVMDRELGKDLLSNAHGHLEWVVNNTPYEISEEGHHYGELKEHLPDKFFAVAKAGEHTAVGIASNKLNYVRTAKLALAVLLAADSTMSSHLKFHGREFERLVEALRGRSSMSRLAIAPPQGSDPAPEIPFIPILASLLRRLADIPEEPPFFGRVHLVHASNASQFSGAAPDVLVPYALCHALPDKPRDPQKKSMDLVIKDYSDGKIQFRAKILPGAGFCKNGGCLANEHGIRTMFPDFGASDCVVFLFGFNDRKEQESSVREAMRKHADSFLERGTKLVLFLQAKDHKNSDAPIVTAIAKDLASERPECIRFVETTRGDAFDPDAELRLPYRGTGWSEADNKADSYHMTERGLREWMDTCFMPFLWHFAEVMNYRKVLVVSDSTLQSHDYPSLDSVIVQCSTGATTTYSISMSNRVEDLKELIAKDYFNDAASIEAAKLSMSLCLHHTGGCEKGGSVLWRALEAHPLQRAGCLFLGRCSYV